MRLLVSELKVEIESSGADVVDEISFTVPAGHTLGLVGESGSGKTTVALALLGYARRGLRISGGRVVIDGVDILALKDSDRRAFRGAHVAYVPQDPASALNPALKIGSQLREVLTREWPLALANARVDEVLDELSLAPGVVVDAYPHQLSGGQQQRVALAMAFALRPSVIVMDEPTTGLDVTTQRRILDTIRGLCASHGVTGVFVSHDLAVIGELVHQVAVMYSGRVVELGKKAEVLGTPSHPYTRGLLRAVPSFDRAHSLIGLEGHPPSPGERPHGCFFAPRCVNAIPSCTDAEPRLDSPLGADHLVRCWRASELVGDLQQPHPSRSSGDALDAEVVLEIGHISASYGSAIALSDISAKLHERECLAIVGESGSGKTTLARCLVGLHERWSGSVALRGMSLPRTAAARSPESLREIQYIFQNPDGSLNPRKRVGQILEQPLSCLVKLDERERAQRIDTALKDAALSLEFRDRYPHELSGGERQRVAIARALVVEPALLVCDEITSALDVSVQATIVETLRALQAQRGLALIFITHNLALVRSIAQRVLVMHEGRAVECDATDAVLQRPRGGYTQRLLQDVPRGYVSASSTPSQTGDALS